MRSLCTPLLLFLSIILTAASCAQNQKKKIPKGDLPKSVSLLPLEGQNRDPQWINGDQIVFHSGERERHTNFQIYLFKVGDTAAKRITYHDGDTDSAVYVPEERALYYSSSTDEVKALSDLVERYQTEEPAPLPTLAPALILYPTEIYRSNLEGGHITRLTHHRGFDGRLDYNPDTKRLLYSALKGDHLQLHSISSEGKAARQLTTTDHHSLEFTYSSRAGRYLWIEMPGEGPSQVWTADKRFRNRKALSLPEGRYQSARFAEGEDLLVSAHFAESTTGYDLYFFSAEKACLIPLLRAKGDQLSPALSPNAEQIAFVHQMDSSSQIALMPFEVPTAPCLTIAE